MVVFTFTDYINQMNAGLLTAEELKHYAVLEVQALTNFLPSARVLGTDKLVKLMISEANRYV